MNFSRRFLFGLGAVAGLPVLPAGAAASGPAGRIRQKAPTTYRIDDNTGDDSAADGSAGKPFKTISACWQYLIRNVDCAAYTTTMQVGPGVYVNTALNGPLWGNHVIRLAGAGSGKVVLRGISGGSGGLFLRDLCGTAVQLSGVTLDTDGAAGLNAFNIEARATVDIEDDVHFGACNGWNILVREHSQMNVLRDVTVDGSSGNGFLALWENSICRMSGRKFGWLSAPAYSQATLGLRHSSSFIGSGGSFDANGHKFGGSGTNYLKRDSCEIDLAGAALATIPGGK